LAELNGEFILAKVQIINGIILTEEEVDALFDKIRQQFPGPTCTVVNHRIPSPYFAVFCRISSYTVVYGVVYDRLLSYTGSVTLDLGSLVPLTFMLSESQTLLTIINWLTAYKESHKKVY
jgi:hypothetical protein